MSKILGRKFSFQKSIFKIQRLKFRYNKLISLFSLLNQSLIAATIAGILIGSLGFLGINPSQVEAELTEELPILMTGIPEKELLTIQDNTLIPISEPTNPQPAIIQRINVIITAYSSTPWETDGDPFLTAAGSRVRDGVVANNLLPLGTKIKIPELYGEKIFIIEDRMHWRKGNYQIDIWFPDYWQALNFGAKRTYIEVLEG